MKYVQNLESNVIAHVSPRTVQIANGKINLKFTFFEDPKSDKLTGIIELIGTSIDSRATPFGVANNLNMANLDWPSNFTCEILLDSTRVKNNNKSKITKVDPTNAINTTEYSSSVGYMVGGEVTYKAPPRVTAEMTWNDSYSYKQPNFDTVLTANSTTRVQWKTTFISAVNPNLNTTVTRDSNSILYGNELFMKDHTANVPAVKNFVDLNRISSLIPHSFQPAFSATLVADKDTKLTPLTIIIYSELDKYVLEKGTLFWEGTNYKNFRDTRTHALREDRYEWVLDWENFSVST
ncbi:leukocidin family pore-forming toxin [Bacillus thuringiensis]|uniref:Alpha-hemolysin n=1 Tax=Bacillus thuringiensis Bt18247 TaxID=1423143 RepID=A0A9W3T074_BACTU|nr:leukocidin family pore-forming toxin [Bacillus thuringiensis]AOM14728.1 alpha-hemolysin [Bacillus thuringiensis Bt18247]MBG9529282.1 hypothetical protein [Bacillus thuringiensis]